ncbi:unnamed protein product, partial [Prorocentrum cordatum]
MLYISIFLSGLVDRCPGWPNAARLKTGDKTPPRVFNVNSRARHMTPAQRAPAALGLALVLGLSAAFVAAPAGAPRPGAAPAEAGTQVGPAGAEAESGTAAAAAPWAAAARLLAGAALGAAIVVASSGAARAEIEDVAIPVDGKGKTRNLSK